MAVEFEYPEVKCAGNRLKFATVPLPRMLRELRQPSEA